MPLGREKRFIHSAGAFLSTAAFKVPGGSAVETAKSPTVLLAALMRLQSTPIGAQRTAYRRGTSVRGYHHYVTAGGVITAALYGSAGSPVVAAGPRPLVATDIQKWFLTTVWVQSFGAGGFRVGLNQNLGTAVSLAPLTYVVPTLSDALFLGTEDAVGTLPGTQLQIGQLVLASGGVLLTSDLPDLYAETQRAQRIADLPGETLRIDFGEYLGKKFAPDGTTVAPQNFGDLARGARVESFLAGSPVSYADPGDNLVADWVAA